MFDVIIIGAGPSGLTAAIYATRANLKTLVIAGEKWGGQLMQTTDVENFPGFPQGIQGPELMMAMRTQAERFKAEIVDEPFEKGDFSKQPFTITAGGKEYQGKSVIIATGADTKWIGLPNEQRLIGHGVSSCAPCDAFFFKNKKVMVVGGGDSAMEEALVLTKFASEVILVHRKDTFRASQIMQDRVKNHPKIHLLLNAEIVDVLGETHVEKVKVKIRPSDKSLLTKSKEELEKISPALLQQKILEVNADHIIGEIPIDGIFVAIGHIPNTSKFIGIDKNKKGYIKRYEKPAEGVFSFQNMTNKDGVFVAGDVYDHQYKQAVTAAAYGCMAALEVEKWLEMKS